MTEGCIGRTNSQGTAREKSSGRRFHGDRNPVPISLITRNCKEPSKLSVITATDTDNDTVADIVAEGIVIEKCVDIVYS